MNVQSVSLIQYFTNIIAIFTTFLHFPMYILRSVKKPSTLYEQLRHLPYPPTYPKSMRTLWTRPFVLNQRSGTYGSRSRYDSFQDYIWLFDSETTLSRHFFKALKNSEYLQKSFPKLVLVSNSGVIARQSIGQVSRIKQCCFPI